MSGVDRRVVRLSGAASALVAGALFGLSTPLAKLLLPGTGPLLLAGLLYLGAGLGLVVVGLLRRAVRPLGAARVEARLEGADYPLLAAIMVVGGVIGPILMLAGLRRVSGVVGSLLLNLEAPLTILLAVVFFREHLGAREVGAALCVVIGVALLGHGPDAMRADAVGIVAVSGACLSWAIDNNLTQRLSLRDPVAIVRAKTLGAGTVSLALAVVAGSPLVGGGRLFAALIVGFVCYGTSIVLAVHALRRIGAARESALFAIAPFVGAIAAIPLLGEKLGGREMLAAGIMGLGIFVLLRERHAHLHVHERLEHDHAHVHDEHHRHEHGQPVVAEPHAHPHTHEPMTHGHPHVSDSHHRHRH